MILKKYLFLVVFSFAVVFYIADCATTTPSEGAGSVAFKASFSFSAAIAKIIKFPITVARILLKVPLTLVQKIIEIITTILKQVGSLDSKVISKIVGLIKNIINQVVDVLVSVGVFQGKTAEDVMNGIMGIIEKLVTFIIDLETTISSTMVDTINNVIGKLNIKKIITWIINLPILKEIAKLVEFIKLFITTNFQSQIDDVKALIKLQYDKHRDFFQPILDSISTRILIISNALHALVDGKLSECSGEIAGDDTPTEGLQWQLNVWIDKVKVFILRILGLADWADHIQDKVDNLTATTSEGLTLPPIIETLTAAITEPPFGSGGFKWNTNITVNGKIAVTTPP